jgi:serine/threonine protein kinase
VSTPPPEPVRTSPLARPLGRLGEYYLLRKIGQGGMGTIYLAKRLGVGGFEKTFVVKCMLESLASSEESVAMFFDEARLAARLTHPNIAQIYDFGVIDGTYYIAMEYIPGEDVAGIIGKLTERRLKIPVQIALRIMLDLAGGLEYAHTLSENGTPLSIIHRDISPSNIMVSYQGAVKLLDFGIAKAKSRISETRSGGLKGKLAYLAPEQIRDLPIDHRCDIFCLGITFYALLTQRHPFKRETEVGTMHAILEDEVPDPRAFRQNLPESVAAILSRALARERDERYHTAGEMAFALQTALARIAPGTGAADVAHFMITLFGKEAMEARNDVPNVANVNLAEVVSPRSTLRLPPATLEQVTAEDTEGPTTLEMPMYMPPPKRPHRRARVAAGGLVAVGVALFLTSVLVAIRTRAPEAPPIEPEPLAKTVTPPPPAPPPPPARTITTTPVTIATPKPLPAPRPRPKAVETPASPLGSATLQSVVATASGRFATCFKRHSADLPTATGQVTVELAVSGSGVVSSARAVLPGISSPALARCLEAEAERLKFPRHSDGEVRFGVPLMYRKGK